jgi:hypothetical protein
VKVRYETWYQATANSSGVQEYVLRIDQDNLVQGKDRDDRYLVTWFSPPIPLDQVGTEGHLWNIRKKHEEALALYRTIEHGRIEKALRALAEVA